MFTMEKFISMIKILVTINKYKFARTDTNVYYGEVYKYDKNLGYY